MSHIANIRKRYRAGDQQEPQKRKKVDSSTPLVNGTTHTPNGVPSPASLSAKPAANAKPRSAIHPAENAAKVRNPDAEEDSEMADSGPEVNGVDSGDSEDDEDDEDSEDDEEDEDEDGSDEDDGGTELGAQEAGGSEDEEDDSDDDLEKESTPKNADANIQSDNTMDYEAMNGQVEEPSFGDLLKTRGQDIIDIDTTYSESHPEAKTLTTAFPERVLTVPTSSSLGTVLTQALRTGDVDLLESCFQITNLESIRATIERLHSTHATSLLKKLAERLHKRPGRAGSLMVWVQWTVVAHGGYLASQPAVMRELQILHQVVKQRATGLQPLLALKGRLDLLEAQLQMRRNAQARSAARHGGGEPGVTYIEGETESSSEDEPIPSMGPTSTVSTKPKTGSRRTRTKNKSRPARTTEDSDEDIEEDMPSLLPNGVDADDIEDLDDEDSEDSDDEDNDIIDDEAEETDEDSEGLSDEVEYEDEVPDSEEDDRPAKRSRSG